jgi:hypothetical protein
MSKPFIEPFEMRESVPEFLTTIVISKKESATLSPVLQDEGSHYFLLVQWEILGHVRIISQYLGRKRPTGSYSPVADGLPTIRPLKWWSDTTQGSFRSNSHSWRDTHHAFLSGSHDASIRFKVGIDVQRTRCATTMVV